MFSQKKSTAVAASEYKIFACGGVCDVLTRPPGKWFFRGTETNFLGRFLLRAGNAIPGA